MSSNDLRPGDLVNLIQRQALELARFLDVPSADVTTGIILAHIERMHAFASQLNAAVTASPHVNGTEQPES